MLVQQFLRWMETAPSARRADATSALARAWLHSQMSEAERNAVRAALTVVLDDPSPVVRMAMAEALARSPDAPRHIILAFVQDQADIAATVLAASPILLDAELVDWAATGGNAMQCAIASRPVLSAAVSAALAEVAALPACMILIGNSGAHITRSAYWRIAERHGDDADLRDALLDHHDLPLDLRQELISKLSASLGEFAVLRAWMAPERAEIVAREACERATVELAHDADEQDMADLVDHLRGTGQLTTVLLLRALCSGHILFFETALAILSELPPERVQALMTSGRHNGLRAIYMRAGLPQNAFAAFNAALDIYIDIAVNEPDAEIGRLSSAQIECVLEAHRRSGTVDEFDQVTVMLRRLATEAAREDARAFVRESGLAA